MDIKIIQKANTKYMGKKIEWYKVIDSTQEEAKRLIDRKVEEGTLILADSQTNGKGTKGNKWHTGEGKNIAMTLVLYPKCKVELLEGFTYQIAEIMVDAIQCLYNIPLEIKLPNDLLLYGKKIGGILTQTRVFADRVDYLIIGLGFNVEEIEFTKEISDIATSLKKEYPNQSFQKEEIIREFLELLEPKWESKIGKK